MSENEVQEVTMEDFFELCKNGGTYQIETPDGWQIIGSLVQKLNKECYNLVLEDGIELGCSSDHYVWTRCRLEGGTFYGDWNKSADKSSEAISLLTRAILFVEDSLWDFSWKKSEDINVQTDFVLTNQGWQQVVAKEHIGMKDTFDLEVKSPAHRYYSNGIVSHNTGKSMTCDALASAYEMPLLRLDFGAVFSAHVGESEQNIRQCLATAEAISPAILWIDEVEKGIGGVESSNATDGGVTSRVFGTMLTWMQDKLAPVFVVCTANNIAGLPPEFMRAGRFDEIFFIDLPNEDQRAEVIEKLLSRKKRDASEFDIDEIVSATHHYTPVEIEKGIDNALFVAYSDGKRKLMTADIVSESKKFYPLYNSRREEIEAMRKWALGEDGTGGRAVLANSPTKPVVDDGESHRGLDIGTSVTASPAGTMDVRDLLDTNTDL